MNYEVNVYYYQPPRERERLEGGVMRILGIYLFQFLYIIRADTNVYSFRNKLPIKLTLSAQLSH